MEINGKVLSVTVAGEEIAKIRVKSLEYSNEPIDVTSDMEGWRIFGGDADSGITNAEWVAEAISQAPWAAEEFYLEAPEEVMVGPLDGVVLNTVHGRYRVETKGLPLNHARLIHVGR